MMPALLEGIINYIGIKRMFSIASQQDSKIVLFCQNLKGVVLEREQFSDGNLLNLFPLLLLSGFFRGEDVICPFQRHV